MSSSETANTEKTTDGEAPEAGKARAPAAFAPAGARSRADPAREPAGGRDRNRPERTADGKAARAENAAAVVNAPSANTAGPGRPSGGTGRDPRPAALPESGDPAPPDADESETTAVEPGPQGDLLLACLRMLAAHFERPASPTVLTAGLPLDDGHLTLDLFERAASRIGLQCRHVARRISALSMLHLPAVMFLKGGAPVVLLRRMAGGEAAVFLPEMNGVQTISAQRLEALARGDVLLVKPVYKAGAQWQRSYGAVSEGHWFWGTVRKFWRSYLQVILAGATINVLALGVPLFIMNVYDRVLPNKAVSTLWVLAAGLALALTFDFLLKLARANVIDHAGRKLDVILSSRLFEKILSTKLSHRPATTGAFANRVAEYEVIREFFTSNTVALFVDFLFIFLFLFIILQLAGWLVVVPALAVVVVLSAGYVIQHLIGKHLASAQEESALRHSILVESVSSIETLKSLRAEGQMLRKWENFARNASNTAQKVKTYSAIGFNFSAFIQQMVSMFVIIGGVYLFASGEISMGAIIATVILSTRCVAPLGAIALSLTRARQAFLSLKTLDEVMAIPDEQVSSSGFVHRDIAHGKIEFRKLSFTYPNSALKVLDGFSLTIRPGERVGIIGRVGSGKTTIGRLATGLYLPDEGEILIDDVDMRQYHPHEVRRAVALVVQEADLFFGSVKENIAIANPLAEDADIIRAAQLAGVDEFVARHPMGYDMPVGERGTLLSGGQRQAVALARALINDPAVIFLDEPSSAMDMATERQLILKLKESIRPEQTLIVTTHRNAMLDLVDRVVVLEGGRVAADGPKDKVISALAKSRRPQPPGAAPARPMPDPAGE